MPAPNKDRTSAKKLKAAERRALACEMRKAGASLQTIADHLGIRVPSVHAHITKAIAQLNAKAETDIEQHREFILRRLDDMTLGIWDKARTGNLKCIDRVVKMDARRAKLLGLDAPTKTDLTSDGKPLLPPGSIVVTDEQIKNLPTEIIERLRSSLAAAAGADDT